MSAAPRHPLEPPSADEPTVKTWLAVTAGALGAMMALLDVSIINSALPVVQGEIGASGSEGTWIPTSYLVAEIVIIPLTGWLTKLFGLRRFLIVMVSLFGLFSTICGLSTTLTGMIIGRVGQGLSGGAMIPTSMAIVATMLPRSRQPTGMAVLGGTAILAPITGPVLGGWLTENLTWHYAFLVNIPVAAGIIAMLALSLPREGCRLELLRDADWLGIAGLTLGFGALTIVLEEGQRELWFDSFTIVTLTGVSILGFVLLTLGQFLAPKAVIDLRLLRNREFASVVVMTMVGAMVSFGTAYMIPQFLANVAKYNALQAGYVVMIAGIPMALLMPFAPRIQRVVPLPHAVAFGMTLLVVSAGMETSLSPLSDGASFAVSQLLRGAGGIFVGLFLNQAAVAVVARHEVADAAGLYSTARNMGGSLALAAIGIVQDRLFWFHARRIEESLVANDVATQDYFTGLSSIHGEEGALRLIDASIQTQAFTMTYNDLFWMMMILVALVTPLSFILKKSGSSVGQGAMH